MKKSYLLLTLVMTIPCQLMAAEQESVYSWGAWAEGLQPAAGSTRVTPPPARQPDVNFRANENSAFLREAQSTISFRPSPSPAAGVPASPTNVIAPVNTPPSNPRDQF